MTLMTSLMILLLSTLVTFSVANAILMEQKISANDLRAKQAFEAAEAGMLAAMNYLGNEPDADNDGDIDDVFDADADGVGDTNSAKIGAGSVTVATSALSDDLATIRITAQGYSDDRSATRTLTQVLVTLDPLPNAPQYPLVTRGVVSIDGTAMLRNPQGHSTIWSGGNLDLGPSEATRTEIPDASAAGYPACVDIPMTCELIASSGTTLKNVDLIENDLSLGALSAGEFFRNFFGVGAASYRASIATVVTTPVDFMVDTSRAAYEVIWVNDDTTIRDNTIGCTTSVWGNNRCPAANRKPCVIVIDGNASLAGTVQLYGLLYVAGTLRIDGNATVQGAILAGGALVTSESGNLDLWYDSGVLADVSKAGHVTPRAGSWKDF